MIPTLNRLNLAEVASNVRANVPVANLIQELPGGRGGLLKAGTDFLSTGRGGMMLNEGVNMLSGGVLADALASGGLLSNGLGGGLLEQGRDMLSKFGSNDRLLSHLVDGRLGLMGGDALDLVEGPLKIGKVRDLFQNALMTATSMPMANVRELLNAVEVLSLPNSGMYRPEVRDFMTQLRVLGLFSSSEPERISIIRTFLNKLRGPGNNRLLENNLLEGIRDDLFNGVLSNEGPLSNLGKPARLYFQNILPVLTQLDETDAYLSRFSGDLSKILGIVEFPIDVAARLIEFKIGMLVDLSSIGVDAIVTLADIGTDILGFAAESVADLVALTIRLPSIGVDLLFEMVNIAAEVAKGVIDIKVAALTMIARIPLEIIDDIIRVPLSLFDELSISNDRIIRNLWGEMSQMLGLYQNYTGMLGVGPEVLPLDYFANMTRGFLEPARFTP